jgi:hypothetical protein
VIMVSEGEFQSAIALRQADGDDIDRTKQRSRPNPPQSE